MIALLEQLQDLEPLLDGKCPDCCGEHFLAGPEGGLTQNVECADCGARFNVCPRCPAIPRGFVERIGR